MKKWLVVVPLVLVFVSEAAGTSYAQENAARAAALNAFSTMPAPTELAAFDSSSAENVSVPLGGRSSSAAPSAGAPGPKPRFIYGFREDYRFQLSLSYAYVRFTSTPFDANLHGLNTTLVYYTNEWFGVEGTVTAAFSGNPSGFGPSSNAKYLFYGGGPRIAWRQSNRRWEPWAHALVGGLHMQPQTALGGRNVFAFGLGGGVDWRWNPRLSVRLGADWTRSGLYSENQNNIQVTAGIVFHF